MKDIDFDELDKAVSSLMGTPGDGKIPSTVSSDISSVASAGTVASAQSAAKQPAPIKRSGRFMDVVHPSSDMRTASPTKVSSRARVSIAPPNREDSTAAPVVSKPSDAVTPLAPPESPKEEALEGLISEKTPNSSASDSPELLSKPSDAAVDNNQDTISSSDALADSIDSLFLPDVKVEKRPLGAANTPEDDSGVEDISSVESTEKVDSLVVPDPTLAELGNDVLAIESDAITDEAKGSGVDQDAATEVSSGATSPSDALASAAISSIPRQYTVKPSGDDDKHHEALYDSAAQAGSSLQHPEKKSSGWLVIMWIVLLIIIGVGGALALYFLKVF